MVTLPSVADVFTSSTALAGEVFTGLFDYMIFAFAIGVGTAILIWVFRKIRGSTKKVFGGGRRGRGRRRGRR